MDLLLLEDEDVLFKSQSNGYLKTALPIVRLCLTVEVQFILEVQII